jgi:hypothetical protein
MVFPWIALKPLQLTNGTALSNQFEVVLVNSKDGSDSESLKVMDISCLVELVNQVENTVVDSEAIFCSDSSKPSQMP